MLTRRFPRQMAGFAVVGALLLAPQTAAQTYGPDNQPVGFGCLIQDNNQGKQLPPDAHGDPLFKVVTEQKFCPENALDFRNLLQKLGFEVHPAMVADRGYHNPLPQGLFSFFEAVTGRMDGQDIEFGDWFFGHFQAAINNDTAATSELAEQQQASGNALLLESVVWDPTIGMFRFYEIRGNGQTGIWFYRGSSLDILKDITNLWRNTDPSQLLFGEVKLGGARLRCSGCHMNGGPVMKELKFPHDMWWRKERPLLLGSMVIQPQLQPILDNVVSADIFSQWVTAGYKKLFASQPYMEERANRTLQEQLRPIFCEQEVNLESDIKPLGDPSADTIQAQAGFFVDPRLLPDGPYHVTIKKDLYVNALNHFQSDFLDFQAGGPRPTDGIDGDHAFETPVKGFSDMLLADAMVASGLVTKEFVLDVVAVDMTRPMFSDARCGLLRLVPEKSKDWLEEFESRLEASPSPAAQELYRNLTDPGRNAAFHQKKAAELMQKVQANAAQQNAVTGYVRLLTQRRIEVFHAQISQHPQGQIFEPDFRLIFPTLQLLKPDQNEIAYGGVPGQFWLSPASGLVELSPP